MYSIRLFPDTGHHIVFIPLMADTPNVPEELEDMADLSKGAADWLISISQKNDWQTCDDKPWLRIRFGKKPYRSQQSGELIEIYGVWCAIETTIGDASRGYVIRENATSDTARSYRGQPVTSAPAKPADRSSATDATTPTTYRGQTVTRKGGAQISNGEHPYITDNAANLPEISLIDLSDDFGFADKIPGVELEAIWVEAAGDSIAVDIIVDFGNSRTVVLALERMTNAQGFASICRPILFPGPGWDADSLKYDEVNFDEVIPESWFTLMDPVFPTKTAQDTGETASETTKKRRGIFGGASAEPAEKAKTKRTPHMFSDISPAVVGPAAKQVLSGINVEDGGLSFLSSPKRYVWDSEPTGSRGDTFWTMNPQPWRELPKSKNRLTPLKGEILRFMPSATEKWSLDGMSATWPGLKEISEDQKPNHSRSDALVWVALSIMEQAQRQIHSETWRKGNQPFLARKLGRVLVTYPAGWTEEEIEAYHKQWSFARDIFAVSRYDDPHQLMAKGELPEIAMELDEAVAPQLAIIFSEIHHMRDYGENWIELYGRGEGNEASVRVMTIDIGGGTTDTSVVEYSDELEGVGVDLTATLLFKDSSTIAGDRLVRDIIERVLLPLLGERHDKSPAERAAFERFYFSRANRDGERAQWSVIARTVFIPIVHQWIRCFSEGMPENPDTGRPWTPSESGASREQIKRLNEMARRSGIDGTLLNPDAPLEPDFDILRSTIHDWFLYIADTHARYLAIFDCDVVILTGKPSELPEIRELLEQRLPIVPNRILSGRGYYAGDWLPLTRDGRIPDAKLVTALGGAVYRGVQTGLISGWRIRGRVDEPYRIQNYWGRIAGEPKPFLEDDVLLAPDQEEAEVRLMTGSFIGRARFLNHVLPEQVYLLNWSGAENAGHMLVDVRIRRKAPKENSGRYAMSSESLELISAVDAQTGRKIDLEDIKLKLCTLPQAEEHWQDTGRFEVRWANKG